MAKATFHVAMFPWLAVGHLTSFLHLANKFAKRGHRVSFLVPTKTQAKLESLIHHPDLICFVPLVVPNVEGLPLGTETTSESSDVHLLAMALERMKEQVEVILHNLSKPDFVFFDYVWWIPALKRRLGIKSIRYCTVGAASTAYDLGRRLDDGQQSSEVEMLRPPPGFPPSSLHLRLFESRTLYASRKSGNASRVQNFYKTIFGQCDAISFRTCREIEGPNCDYVESQYGKPVLLSGPVLPKQHTFPLEERWSKWLGGFKAGSVVYCSFGTECVLKKEQFQEVVLGFELTGLPFFVALKPPLGAATVEEALPEGFEERIRGRGVVHGGFVQQTLILEHPSVGCFVSHCGFSSMWEALMNECQIVLVPDKADQSLNTRIMVGDLKVAVEVERREEDGWFTRENVCKAVKLVMDEENQIGREVRGNHAKWKDLPASIASSRSYMLS